MYSAIRIFSLMSIVSLILGSLTGCGEKRIHVATVSGAPGQEAVALSPINESATTEAFGLSDASLDESALSVQDSAADELFMEAETSSMTNEPIQAHALSVLSSQDGSTASSLPETIASTQESDSFLPDTMMPAQESSLSGNDGLLDPLREGQDFHAQSSSLPINEFDEPTRTQYSDSIPSALSQNPTDGLEKLLLGEGGEEIEPVLDVFQIAKAEPSDNLQDRLNRIKEEEFAKAANLEDVFFQFDSWTLTQEGKQSLQRTLGWFEQDPSSNLIIEGHADQRGTQAYNMVLAKKRAVAVQDYLSQLGIESSRMAVISYGKDKPFCEDVTEVCYQLNRRGHLLIPNR